jgi:type VI secretion system secreted protein Hcp
MAQTVHLTLWNSPKDKGPQIKGESTQLADGREGTIECVSFESSVTTPRDAGSGKATGRRQFAPIKIRKRIDASSPDLVKALTQNIKLDGKFDFYRPASDGVGGDQAFYTIEFERGFISDLTVCMPDTMDNPGLTNAEAYEVVTFTFDQITWRYNSSKPTEHTDSWSGAERK